MDCDEHSCLCGRIMFVLKGLIAYGFGIYLALRFGSGIIFFIVFMYGLFVLCCVGWVEGCREYKKEKQYRIDNNNSITEPITFSYKISIIWFIIALGLLITGIEILNDNYTVDMIDDIYSGLAITSGSIILIGMLYGGCRYLYWSEVGTSSVVSNLVQNTTIEPVIQNNKPIGIGSSISTKIIRNENKEHIAVPIDNPLSSTLANTSLNKSALIISQSKKEEPYSRKTFQTDLKEQV